MGIKTKIGMGVAVLAVASIAMRRRGKAKKATAEKKKKDIEREERRSPFRFPSNRNISSIKETDIGFNWTKGATQHISATFTMTPLLSPAQAASLEAETKVLEAAVAAGKCPVGLAPESPEVTASQKDPTSYIIAHDFASMQTMMKVCSAATEEGKERVEGAAITEEEKKKDETEFLKNYLSTVCPFFSQGGEPNVETLEQENGVELPFAFLLTTTEHCVLMNIDREKSLSISLVVEIANSLTADAAKELAIALGSNVIVESDEWVPTTGQGVAQPILAYSSPVPVDTTETEAGEDKDTLPTSPDSLMVEATPLTSPKASPLTSQSPTATVVTGGRYVYENDSMGIRFLVLNNNNIVTTWAEGSPPLVVEGRLTAEPQVVFYPNGHQSTTHDGGEAEQHQGLSNQVMYTVKVLAFPKGWADANKGQQYNAQGSDGNNNGKSCKDDLEDQENKEIFKHDTAMSFTPWYDADQQVPVELTSICGVRCATFEQISTEQAVRMRCWIVPHCGKLYSLCWECPEVLWANELSNVRRFLDGLHFFAPQSSE